MKEFKGLKRFKSEFQPRSSKSTPSATRRLLAVVKLARHSKAASTAWLLTAVLSLSAFASTRPHEICNGFVPENDMKIPVGHKHPFRILGVETPPAGGLNEAQFNAVIDRLIRLYGPDVQKQGGNLQVNRLWDDATVNANAQEQGSTWIVNMYGGLARHPAITVEGFALVICHETGHHLGGAPKIQDWMGGSSWASNEGAADYFATLKCLRRFFAEDDNEAIVASAQIDPIAQARCQTEFSSRADQLLCLRSSMAGASVSYLFMDLRKETVKPTLGTPDSNVVSTMFDAHPATQCRMDTYFNGAICHVDQSLALSNTDYAQGSCVQPQDPYGWRPRCWFKP